VPEHTIGASHRDTLLAPIAIGLGGRPRGRDGVLKTAVPRPELRQLYDVLFDLYSTSTPPSAR
jgi:hypothetical protein